MLEQDYLIDAVGCLILSSEYSFDLPAELWFLLVIYRLVAILYNFGETTFTAEITWIKRLEFHCFTDLILLLVMLKALYLNQKFFTRSEILDLSTNPFSFIFVLNV